MFFFNEVLCMSYIYIPSTKDIEIDMTICVDEVYQRFTKSKRSNIHINNTFPLIPFFVTAKSFPDKQFRR